MMSPVARMRIGEGAPLLALPGEPQAFHQRREQGVAHASNRVDAVDGEAAQAGVGAVDGKKG
jgi:hypothetical protein